MAFSKRPTFLKRQKEQQRLARAARKREERLARKRAKSEGLIPDDEFGSLEDLIEGPDDGQAGDPVSADRETGEEARG